MAGRFGISSQDLAQEGQFDMQIHLHVGVHKTATTFIQSRLSQSRRFLTESGIGYMPLMPFRKFFTSKFWSLRPKQFQSRDYLKNFFVGKPPHPVEKLIISDENLIGMCTNVLESGTPYPRGRKRLEHIRSLFPEAEFTLYCAVRSYDTFISSAYCESMRNNGKFVSFPEYWKRCDLTKMNWATMVDDLVEGIRPVQVKLWRYEDFRTEADSIISNIAFDSVLPEAPAATAGAERASFSQTAVEVLDLIAQAKGAEVASRLIGPVGDNLPKAEGFPTFDPWTDEERRSLRQTYDDDCGKIDKSYWIKPLP